MERFSGRFWTWLDREEFLVPKNVLDIVAGQTITWMGLFYCPLLPLLNSVFIFLTFYIKKVSDTGWGGGVEPLSAGRGSGPASARPLGVPSPGPRAPWHLRLTKDPHLPLLAPSTPS